MTGPNSNGEADAALLAEIRIVRERIEALRHTLETTAPAPPPTRDDRPWEGELAHYAAKNEHSLEMTKSAIAAGKEALGSLVLINGGALVAMLGFLGATASKSGSASLALSLSTSLGWFGAGVLAGALGFGARYASQAFYAAPRPRVAISFHVVALVFAMAGYAAFGIGVTLSHAAFALYFSA